MTADEIQLVRASLAIATENRLETAALFYGRLFKLAPQLKPVIGDLHVHAIKLMGIVGLIGAKLDRLEEIEPELEELAQRWTARGVIAEHYALFADALIFAVAERLGPAFRPRTAAAWGKACARIVHVMATAAEGRQRLAA